jgi:hypothetical protein
MPLTQVQSGILADSTQTYGMKNRIINGDMRIDQRGAGSSRSLSTISEVFPVDRFMVEQGGVNSNTGTVQRVTDAPTGFTFSTRFTAGSASFNSTGFDAFNQRIEGQNLFDLSWGTANAAAVTLSFWVKSSVTGLYTVNMTHYDGVTERWNNITYNINQANTWEYKTLTFVGDTTSGITNDNGANGWMRVYWHLGGGGGEATTTSFNTWFNGTGSKRAATGSTNITNTSGATWQITGVQLEKGSTATAFDFRSFGTELQLCQRYYQQFGGEANYQFYGTGIAQGSTASSVLIYHPVTMRTAPSFSSISATSLQIFGTGGGAVSSLTLDTASTTCSTITAFRSGLTAANGYMLLNNNSTTPRLQFSAEL